MKPTYDEAVREDARIKGMMMSDVEHEPAFSSAEVNAVIERGPQVSPVAALLDRIAAHEAENAAIDAEMTKLGLDDKKLKAIRKAAEKAAAAQKTLDALTGAGLVTAAEAEKVAE